MGVKERKAREKAALRANIIETANQLFLEHGFEGTSIRQIASAIEYSPATIYLYFEDKKAIFSAILESAFAKLKKELDGAGIIADPLSRLQELCRRYLAFAKKQPHYYHLIFSQQEGLNFEAGELPYTEEVHQYFIRTIQDCKKEGYFLSKAPQSLALTIWIFVHGQAMLQLENKLTFLDTSNQELLMDESFQLFFAMLRSF